MSDNTLDTPSDEVSANAHGGSMSMAAKPNGGRHWYESPHEQRRVARAVAAVRSMGRFIFLCGSPDQDAAALHDCIPARWIGRRDPERVGESRRNENARRQAGLARVFRNGPAQQRCPVLSRGLG